MGKNPKNQKKSNPIASKIIAKNGIAIESENFNPIGENPISQKDNILDSEKLESIKKEEMELKALKEINAISISEEIQKEKAFYIALKSEIEAKEIKSNEDKIALFDCLAEIANFNKIELESKKANFDKLQILKNNRNLLFSEFQSLREKSNLSNEDKIAFFDMQSKLDSMDKEIELLGGNALKSLQSEFKKEGNRISLKSKFHSQDAKDEWEQRELDSHSHNIAMKNIRNRRRKGGNGIIGRNAIASNLFYAIESNNIESIEKHKKEFIEFISIYYSNAFNSLQSKDYNAYLNNFSNKINQSNDNLIEGKENQNLKKHLDKIYAYLNA